jgi:hypothetical protein
MMSTPAATRAIAALLLAFALTAPAGAQTTIFDTPDVRQDRDRWTDPTYYRNNTVGQLRGMAIGTEPGGGSTQQASSRVYGSQGTGKVGAGSHDTVSIHDCEGALRGLAEGRARRRSGRRSSS